MIEELLNQELLRHERRKNKKIWRRETIRKYEERERIRQRELEQAKERRALELKRINEAKSREEKIRLCNQYIYEIQEGQRKRN